MPRFVFRLDPLLRLRRNQRDHCRQLLAEIVRRDDELQGQRRQIELQRITQFDEIRHVSAQGPVNVDGALSRRQYLGQLVFDIAQIERNRALLQQQMQLCRQALIKADQGVKVLEKLAEKQHQEFRFQQDQREARDVEETWQAMHMGDFRRC